MKKLFQKFLFLTLGISLLSSCGMYRQNIMFSTDNETLKEIVKVTEKNYMIKPGDMFELTIYSNNGELIIDPNFILRKEIGIGGNNNNLIQKPSYLVRPNGEAKLPMLGLINLEGLTLYQTDSLLSAKYSDFYVESFAVTTLTNRRIIVLGGSVGGQVIPLTNENMSLLEVIALAGGVENSAKAHNIRLIRGDLNSPQVEVIDLSSISGMMDATMYVQPNDIVYIEPVRKVVIEGVRDISPILSLFTSVLTLAFILSR